MPPSPICSSSLYGPMSVPGRSASGDSAGDRSIVAPNSAAGFVQKAVRVVVGLEQGFDPHAESGVAADGFIQERGPLGRRFLAGSQEDRLDVVRVGHFAIFPCGCMHSACYATFWPVCLTKSRKLLRFLSYI